MDLFIFEILNNFLGYSVSPLPDSHGRPVFFMRVFLQTPISLFSAVPFVRADLSPLCMTFQGKWGGALIECVALSYLWWAELIANSYPPPPKNTMFRNPPKERKYTTRNVRCNGRRAKFAYCVILPSCLVKETWVKGSTKYKLHL